MSDGGWPGWNWEWGWRKQALGLGWNWVLIGLRASLRTLGDCLGAFMDTGVMYKRSIDHIKSARIAYLNISPLAEYEGELQSCFAAS